MRKKHTAIIKINLSSKELAKTIHWALKPESDTRTQITVEDSTLIINLEAETVATLRALANSYLRWIITVKNTIDATNAHFETHRIERPP